MIYNIKQEIAKKQFQIISYYKIVKSSGRLMTIYEVRFYRDVKFYNVYPMLAHIEDEYVKYQIIDNISDLIYSGISIKEAKMLMSEVI